MTKKVEITHKTIFFTVFFLLGLWFVYYIRDILFQLLVSFVIVSSFNPFVEKLEKRRIPRPVGAVIAYTIFLGAVIFLVYILAPSLVIETSSFVKNVPDYISNIGLPLAFREQILGQFLLQVGQLPVTIARTAVSIFSNIIDVITVLILSFYILVSRQKLNTVLDKFFNETNAQTVLTVIDKIETRVGAWAKAELLLMAVVGLMTYIGLLLLKVPYALPLAMLAGLFEIVPMVGPFLAAVPAVIIGFGMSPFTGTAAASLAFLIQQVENYVLVPKIMQRSAGVNPVVTLLALSVGFRLQGVAGAIISIPVVLALNVILNHLLINRNKETA